MNRTCAGPPTRNQVSSASDWLASSRPRSSGIFDFKSGAISTKVIASCRSGSRHRAERGELARQGIGPLRDVAGAEADDDVARLRQSLDDASEVLRAVERDTLAMAVRAQALQPPIATGPGERRLARG